MGRLAHDLATVLASHPEDFPSPPVPPEQIHQALAAYDSAREAASFRCVAIAEALPAYVKALSGRPSRE